MKDTMARKRDGYQSKRILLGIGYSVKIQAVPLSGKVKNRLSKALTRQH